MFSCEQCKIFKNTNFEKYLRTAASDSSYILHKKLNKVIQESFVSFWNIKSFYFTYSYSFYICFITRCHSLSLIIIFCYLLSFVVTGFHSLPLFVIRSHSVYHSLSLVVPLVCLFINGHVLTYSWLGYAYLNWEETRIKRS